MAPSPMIQGQPSVGQSPAATASANPGAQAKATAKIREAVQIIVSALQDLPPGSEELTKTSKIVGDLSKMFPESEAQPGIQNSMLRDLVTKAQQQQAMQALQRQQSANQNQPQPEPQPQQA